MKYLNLCRSCEQDFASVSAFDRHRVGVHAYTHSGSLKLDPPREDGRRCLDTDELRDVGMELDARGRWAITADAERARKAFRKTAEVTR